MKLLSPITWRPRPYMVGVLVVSAAAALRPGPANAQAEAPAAAASASTESVPAYTLDYAQDTFDRFYGAGEYLEAVDAGKLVIDVLLRQGDVDQIAWGEALAQLASAQRFANDYEPAIQNYQTAIDVIEAATNRLSPQLVGPLWGLSRTYADAGELNEAVESFNRTLHVQRVNSGLHSLDQSEMLVELSELYFSLGDDSMADAMQQANVNLATRNYPGDDLRKLPALYSRVEMLERTGHHIKAHERYRRIIDLIERAEGSRSLTLLPALYKIADVFLYNEMLDGYKGAEQARRYLRRAVVIVEKNENATELQKADAYLAMADYLSLKSSNRGIVLREYRKAWDVLSGDEELLVARDERFGAPVPLNDVPGNRTPAFGHLVESSSKEYGNEGFVVVEYDVDSKGLARNIEVIESEPPGFRDSIVAGHLERVLFRPRFVDGEPTDTADNRYEIRFTYHAEEPPAETFGKLVDSDASD